MANKKKHRAAKAAVCVIAALLIGTAGYFAGVRSQTDSFLNALPHAAKESMPPGPVSTAAAGNEDIATETAAATAAPAVLVGKSDVSAVGEGRWSTVDSCNHDITGDGLNDTVTLYTSAEADDMGILWDDSQRWVLEVSDGGTGYYTLLDTTITNGSVYYQVNELSGGERSIVVYTTTGAGTEISEYVFGRSGFTENDIFTSSGINTVHSSIPWYK